MSAGLTLSQCFGALALSAALAAGCNRQTPPPQRRTSAGSDDERVRVAVLDTIAGRVRTAKLVLSGVTWVPGDPAAGVIAERARDQSGAPADMLADFRARAASEVALGSPNGTSAEIVVVPPAELASRDGEDADAYWQRFRQVRAPATGWVRVSQAGFKQDRSSAMVAAEYRCGTQCGWGVLYMLSRVTNGWRITEEVILWVH
jgi:hypothetical protein